MPTQGQVKAINGQTLEVGVFAGVKGTVTEPAEIKADPQHLDRSGKPPEFVQSGVDPQVIDVVFTVADYPAKKALKAALDFPTSKEPMELQAYWGDPANPTLCTADVAISQLAIEPGSIVATFEKSDMAWRSVAVRSLHATPEVTAAGAATLINRGDVRAAPYFKLRWTVQRATSSAGVGWKYRRQITITNNTLEDWEDELISIDAGDTAAMVTASKAQADGDDVRIWYQGEEVYRTLTCFNTLKTQIHFLVNIKAGASATYDIVYGNPSANAPRTMSTKGATRKTYAAPDLEGDSGTATAGGAGDVTILTDGTKNWETNRWRGGWIGLLSGTGSVRWRRILSNTATVITFNRAVVTAAQAGTTYVIMMAGIMWDGGRVTGGVSSTQIQDTGHTRKFGPNSLNGATVTFTGASTAVPLVNTILSHTADTITFATAFSVNPSVNDQFTIQRQGTWTYVVDTTLDDTIHRGIYRENLYYGAPTRIWPNGDTPAGWQLETRLPNDDDFGVYPPYNIGSSGGHAANWWPNLRVYRRVRQDKRFVGEGVADGYSLYSAFGFVGWYFDYYWRNINGVGQAVFACMDVGGQDWRDLITNTATEAVLVNVAAQHVDLTSSNNPTRLYMGALPNDGVEIPSTAGQADQIELRTYQALEVYHNITSFGGLTQSVYVLGSEVECYQMEARIRIGGGRDAERIAPFEEIVVGGAGHRVMLPATYQLWINTDPAPGVPLIGIYDVNDALVQVAAWAARFESYVKNASDGTAIATQSREFSPIPPAINMITNGYFGSNVTGWTKVDGAGVTSTMARVASPDATDGVETGSMEVDITTTPAGAWDITISWASIALIPGQNYPFGFAYRATNIGSSLAVEMVVDYNGGLGSSDPATTLGGAPAAIDTWYYAAEDEVAYKQEPGTLSAFGSTTSAQVSLVISGTGSYVGKVNIDQVTFGVPNVHVTQTDGGTIVLNASFQEGFLA